MDEPVVRPGRWILAVTGAVDPVALASLIFDAEIVTHGRQLGISAPPLPEDPLWPVSPLHATADTAPGERHWGVVGQQRNCLDRLHRRQKTRWTRPLSIPGLARFGRHRQDFANRPFGHVAGHRGNSIKPALPDPIAERVDQAGDVGDYWFGQRGDVLHVGDGLGQCRRQRHELDSEPRVDPLDLVGEQARKPPDVTNGRGRHHPDGFHAAIYAFANQVEMPNAQTSCLELLAEVAH